MAASSSSSSAEKEYDVFISFRGEDTRYNFTSHLVSALRRKSVKVYVDYELRKGDEISPSLNKAIRDSYGSLVIFSENYASSRWCLNELLTIFEQRKQEHFIVPVFYNIDPSHVRKQTGSYEKAFAKHKNNPQNREKLQLWKAALKKAAGIVGWDSQSRTNRHESELIENIVNDIVQKMNHIYQRSQSSFVGIDKYCEDIELLLQRYPLVGIWGMGGIGKTTIARVMFRKLFFQYDSCCFFENVREESERSGLNYIRNKLLYMLLKDENFHSSTVECPAPKFAMRRLGSKKALIVLDDVNSHKQLEQLQEECMCLGQGSKIIITTRDKHVLFSLRVEHEIYEVEGLNYENSLKLFRLYAFNEKYTEIGYEEITKKVVDYARGIPLALKVLGSFLLSKSKEQWDSALAKLNKFPNDDIHNVLRLSYDGLDYLEQQIFLDIACFLRGDHIEGVISLLDNFGFYGHVGVRTLEDKALVNNLSDQTVHMHDLIQEIGCYIVRKESIKSPEKRSRLHDFGETYDVLINDKGTDTIEGIMLDLSQFKELYLKTDPFRKMTNLRFVKFYSSNESSCKVDLPRNIELPFKKLSYLRWDGYPLPYLPTNFCAEKLVMLHLPYSKITKLWDGVQDVVNLKEINLWGCTELMELPDFSKASKLECVILCHCSKLCHFHPSLLHLDSLLQLCVYNCEKLRSVENAKYLKSLQVVSPNDYSNLQKFSLSSEKLEHLVIYRAVFETFPISLEHSRKLKYLSFSYPNRKIQSRISRLPSLEQLHIRFADSSELPVLFDALHPLQKLSLIDCNLLLQVSHNISMLSLLKTLSLNGRNVESLPESIKHLKCLECIDVSNCQRLPSLLELPSSIKRLLARNCSILETLIPPTALEHCDLKNCEKLDEHSFSYIATHIHYRINQVEATRVCLPGDRALGWFGSRTTQNMISIELPQRSNLLGFVFGLYFSHEITLPETIIRFFESPLMGCKCYLGYNDTEKLLIGECHAEYDYEGMQYDSDDVYMWIYKCDSTLDSFNEISETRGNCLVSFQFYAFHRCRPEGIELNQLIKGCGVWPIYSSELELELGDNSKKNLSKLEYFEHQGIEVGGLNHENQDRQIPQKEMQLGDKRKRF